MYQVLTKRTIFNNYPNYMIFYIQSYYDMHNKMEEADHS